MSDQEMMMLVTNVGFPIFMSLQLLRYMRDQQDQMRQTISELRDAINMLIERLGHSNE